MVSESSWNRTEAATEELINSAPSVKPHAITLRCTSPAAIDMPLTDAGETFTRQYVEPAAALRM